MAPQASGPPSISTGDGDGPFGQGPSAIAPPGNPITSSHLNIPMLALGLALTTFLLVCLSVCLCTYCRAKPRNRTIRNRIPAELERGRYVGLGLEGCSIPMVLVEDKETKRFHGEEVPPPAYTPKQMPERNRSLQSQPSSLLFRTPNPDPHLRLSLSLSPNPLLSLSASPALVPASASPAFSGYSASPALSQDGNEEASLLGSRSRPLTPPPPTYAR